MGEHRIFGPPGTGKTTTLSRWMGDIARRHGSESLLVASFTRAAAAEIAGRNTPIDRDRIGTLHAHCYRALRRPKIAETVVEDWNATHPALRLSAGQGGSLDEAAVDVIAGATQADALAQQYQVLRNKQRPRELWPTPVREFAARWEEWKASGDLLDFTDLIEVALRDVPQAPGRPRFGIFDEVQDFTALELALVRRWGERMDEIVLAGDDDQAIYSFKGADAEAFLDPPLPPDHVRVLPQSYRIPRVVQELALRWVGQLTRRQPKEYRPRDEQGELRRAPATWAAPEAALEDAQQYLAQGKTVMFLAACGYMLDPLQKLLRDQGLPFWNPYRVTRGDWNPLQAGGGVSSTQRLLTFLAMKTEVWGDEAHVWTPEEVRMWSDPLKVRGFLKRGARVEIEDAKGDGPIDVDWFFERVEEDAIGPVIDGSLDWYEGQLVAAKQKGMAFPLAVARKHGAARLREQPRIILGTIHSVKGGQADVVYLFPDLSANGMREWVTPGAGRDSVVRQFYVGMTRCRDSLVVCSPSGSMFVQLGVA